jgi:GNAT superfamily N-acetyltransferase
MAHDLVYVKQQEDWRSYHEIRRVILFEDRGRYGVYDENHPDEHLPDHHPLLLKFYGSAIGTARIDNFNNGTGAIRLVSILKSEQGKGHGRVLSRMVEDFAKSIGIKTLYVNAAPEAVGYYERLNWKPHMWDSAELTGISQRCIQMLKTL